MVVQVDKPYYRRAQRYFLLSPNVELGRLTPEVEMGWTELS
jgi:hypothetical protein